MNRVALHRHFKLCRSLSRKERTFLHRSYACALSSSCIHSTSAKLNISESNHRRVVVTGIGLVTCLGLGKTHVWEKLLSGECGLGPVNGKEYEKIPCKVTGFIPRGDNSWQLDPDKFVSPSDQRTMSQGSVYALIATEEALTDAKWKPDKEEDQIRTGVAIGMGLVGMQEIVTTGIALKEGGYRQVQPHFMPKILVNMSAGNVSLKYGFQGPNHAVSTACTTGLHAIGDAFRFVQRGDADVMIAGGTEESPNPLSVAGFSRMRALCTKFNNTPKQASRPFDKDRDGFVMSEGAGVVVLEELSHAQQRGANIYGEVLGYGLSGDSHHMTAPRKDGFGAFRCMRAALNDANLQPKDVQYINAHATSTPLGDAAESQAIWKLFHDCDKPLVSSTKGALGHLLGAAGSVETIFTILACYHGIIPPTINLHCSNTGVELDYVPLQARNWPSSEGKRTALTNSFGFGGTNGSLCIQFSDEFCQ